MSNIAAQSKASGRRLRESTYFWVWALSYIGKDVSIDFDDVEVVKGVDGCGGGIALVGDGVGVYKGDVNVAGSGENFGLEGAWRGLSNGPCGGCRMMPRPPPGPRNQSSSWRAGLRGLASIAETSKARGRRRAAIVLLG